MENFVQLKKSMDAIKEEKKDLEHDYTTVERAYNRLLEEHKELQLKHEKICSKVKTIKVEKDLIIKDHNAISVAFENSKQCLKDRTKSSEKELTKVKLELGKPLEFKAEKVAEEKKSKKAAKKNRKREEKVVTANECKESCTKPNEDIDKVETVPHKKLKVGNNFEKLVHSGLNSKSNNNKDKPKETNEGLTDGDANLARTAQNNLEKDSILPPNTEDSSSKPLSNNVLEWNAEEFSEFLNDCLKNHRSTLAE